MIRHFPLCILCDMNPPLVYFLKMERAIRPRGQSQAAIGLIVLLNGSFITIRLRLPMETNYSQGVQKKGETQRKEPPKKTEENLWPPHWEAWHAFVCHWNQSNVFWLLIMADTDGTKKCCSSLFMLLFCWSVIDSSDASGAWELCGGSS